MRVNGQRRKWSIVNGGFWVFAIYHLLFTPSAVYATVTLPIEVLGPDGTVVPVTVTVPPGQSAGITSLWMQVHNLSYPNNVISFAKGSVQVNNGPWTDLTNQTVQVAYPGNNYGGIGGAYSTLKLTLPLPSGTVMDGDNTITFQDFQSDRRRLGRLAGAEI